MSAVLAIAPHPDDETLGCGGALLRHVASGEDVHWLIVTDMRREYGFPQRRVAQREAEIREVSRAYGFSRTHNLGLPPAKLDTLPKNDLISAIGQVVKAVSPQVIYLPYRNDAHSDHAAVFDAAVSCTKWFRYPSVRRVLCYETLSETDVSLNLDGKLFWPNSFIDIVQYLERKIEIAQIYQGEMGVFPFPRSAEALRALAQVRGVACGCRAAESFMLLREINNEG